MIGKRALWGMLLFGGVLIGGVSSQVFAGGGGEPLKRPFLRPTWILPTREPVWTGDHGVEHSNLMQVGRTLFFGTRSQGLWAWDLDRRRLLWSLKIPKGVQGEWLAFGENLYGGGGDGYLYAVSQQLGSVVWKVNVRTPFLSQPQVTRGWVLASSPDDSLYAFEIRTGKKVWQYQRRSLYPIPKVYGAAQPVVVDDREVWVGWSDGMFSALDLQTGQLLWEKSFHPGGKFLDLLAPPVFEEGVVYLPSYDGHLSAFRKKDREILWRFEQGGGRQVAIEGDRLYLPSSEGSLFVLSKQTGRLLWSFRMEGGGVPSQVILTPQEIWVASSQHFLYCLSKQDGKVWGRFHVGADSGWTGRLLWDAAKESLYALSDGGNLYQFRSPVWGRSP